MSGSYDKYAETVSTEYKEVFIDYLKKHQSSFHISDEVLNEKEEYIRSNYLSGTHVFLENLPGVSFEVREDDKSRIYVDEGRNGFKDAYPYLYQIIRDDFTATDFKYIEEEEKVEFTFLDKKHKINTGKKAMIDFIIAHTGDLTSEKQFYLVPSFSSYRQEYFFMTPDQKNELNGIVELSF